MQDKTIKSNALRIPAGEALPPLEHILDAARQEAIDLDLARKRLRPRPKLNLDVPEVLFIGSATRFDQQFATAIEKLDYPSLKAETVESARNLIDEHVPDVVVIDSRMPGRQTVDVFREFYLRNSNPIYIVFMESSAVEPVAEAFRIGASEVLLEPVTPKALLDSLARIVKRRREALEEDNYRENLERVLNDRTGLLIGYMEALKDRSVRLDRAFRDVIDRLGRAAQWRDDETGNHTMRIGLFSAEVAQTLGLPKAEIELLRQAAPLHDIGKIGVPDGILLKPGKLTEFEFQYMKTHTQIGAEILTGSDDPTLRAAETIALSHHEWYNGNGYPYQIRRNDIPLYAKIVSVVDVYDAMVHERSYKKAVPLDETIEIMVRRKGSHFDPEVLEAFLETVESLVRIENRLESTSSSETKYDIQFGLHNMTRHLEKAFRLGSRRPRTVEGAAEGQKL